MTGRRAVVAVLLPREHLPFIRDWCRHHVEQGWEVVLYDNTGSVRSRRLTCAYHEDRRPPLGHDGRGVDYSSHTAALSDEAVSAVLAQLVRDLPVRIVPWHPTDEHGALVFDQVEAYVHFIGEARDRVEWAAFIDADEYLRTGAGCTWDDATAAALAAGCSRLVLEGVEYEARWGVDGRPRDLADLTCRGSQEYGWKNVVRLPDVLRADIHYAWTMAGDDRHARMDPRQYWFDHYRGEAGDVGPRLSPSGRPLRTHLDESLPVAPPRRAVT